jgi:hypothetical protein
MTVRELRESLLDVPDELEVLRKEGIYVTEVYEGATAFVKVFGNRDLRVGIGKIAERGKPFFVID